MCARRNGEPDKRTTVVSVRGPDQHTPDAFQPGAVVVFLGSVCVDAGVPPVRLGGYGDGQSPVSYDPAQVVEIGSASANQRAAGGFIDGKRLAISRTLRPDLLELETWHAVADLSVINPI